VISVSQLSYAFDASRPLAFPDFHVAKGEQVLLLGQSGSGKTTLLHLAGGLRRNYRGSVRIRETELSSLAPAALDHFRGQNIGFIFQRNHLMQALSVEDNLRMAPYLAGLRIDQQRILAVLDQLGLASYGHKRIHQLSQGQAQRVAIARAVLNGPSILFADEPTSSLDDANCVRVIDLLQNVARENASVLVVATHDRRLIDRFQKQIVLS
jgi:ABC-type lipoprotein export system ATPase subunit